MPLIKLQTSSVLSDEKRKNLLASISKLISECMSKPEKYVMVSIDNSDLMMSGTQGNAAFADVRGIGGLNSEVKSKISRKLCDMLTESLDIPQDRVYINFTDVSAGNWGWNGATFG